MFRSRLLKPLMLLLIASLLAATGFNGFRIYQLYSNQAQSLSANNLSSQSIPSGDSRQLVASSAPSPGMILSWHLLGKPAPAIKKVPQSRLKLTLIGVIHGPSESIDRAIVKLPSGEQQTYEIGETINNQVSIISIHNDHIILKNGNQEEAVYLNSIKSNPNFLRKI